MSASARAKLAWILLAILLFVLLAYLVSQTLIGME